MFPTQSQPSASEQLAALESRLQSLHATHYQASRQIEQIETEINSVTASLAGVRLGIAAVQEKAAEEQAEQEAAEELEVEIEVADEDVPVLPEYED